MKRFDGYLLLIILFFLLNFSVVYAQDNLQAEAPTLSVGLNSFSFSKGTLDAQLIMEIVAEKQKELKIKGIQNVFLKKVEDTGGTVYTFVDNVVRELVFEPDPNVRSKKIIENTVNLVFTYYFLEFYLTTLDSKDQKESLENVINLAKICNPSIDTEKLKDSGSLRITDLFSEFRTNKFYHDTQGVNTLALLLDMASKTIQEDPKLAKLGLMKIDYSQTYQYLNKYNQIIFDRNNYNDNESGQNKDIGPLQKMVLNPEQEQILENYKLNSETNKLTLAKAVYEDMQDKLANCTNYIGVVNYLAKQKTFRFDNTVSQLEIEKSDELKFDNKKLKSIKKSIKDIHENLESQVLSGLGQTTTLQGGGLVIQQQDSKLIKDIQKLTDIYFYIDKAIKKIEKDTSDTTSLDLKIYADILYTLSNDFTSILKDQSYRSSQYLDIINILNDINETFFTQIISNNSLLKKYNKEVPQFLQLVSNLYEFDKSKTISDYLELLDDIGTTFPDDNIRNALSTVLKFVKDYSIIQKDEDNKEVISFNIESFIYKLQSIKPYRNQRLSFMFTVGVNNSFFKRDLELADSSMLRNLSFVGEKIGVKYKLYNWAFSRSRNPGETYKTSNLNPLWNTDSFIRTAPPKEPIVSNWHLLAYGSGILYNLVNTKTQKEFNMPIIAAGTGLTFFNGLDINVTWGIPIMPQERLNTNNGFWNVGFDIQFIEYYNRLLEKRRNNQMQKKLVQAQK